ncbi:MAG: diguanylate cyclase [Elusimicrobia bacterium]|nr:diguanylate cyclase [Elusimicrobiota bacterium]
MGIKTKLFLAAAITVITVMLYGIWSERHQNRLGEIMSRTLAPNVQAMNAAAELKHAFVSYDDLIMRFMVTGESGLIEEAGRHKKTARERMNELGQNSISATIKKLLAELEQESRLYFVDVERLVRFYQETKFPEGGPIEIVAVWGKQFPRHKQSLTLLSSSGRQRLARIYAICEKILDINRVALEGAEAKVNDLLEEGRQAAQWAGIIAFIAVGTITLLLAFSILRPLGVLLQGVQKITGGDLNFEMRITSADEIGTLTQAFNSMTRNLKEKQEQLVRETITDALTGIYNFRYFQEVIRREVERARRYARPLSILIIDIDHFKHYNDNQGHEMGNVILKMTAQMLRETLRTEDTLARYGGEEFVALLADTDKEQALVVAERLRQAVETAPYPGADKQPLGKVTVSMGGSAYPADARTAQSLLERADRALYRAKADGRNRIAWS